MVKLIVALSLLACEANAILREKKLYARVDELEAQAEVMKGLVQCLSEATAQQCDEVCADVIAISSRPFPIIESGTHYEVNGTFPISGIIPTDMLVVRNVVKCAKITVPSDSGLRGMSAQSRVRLPREMLRRGARRSTAKTRRS